MLKGEEESGVGGRGVWSAVVGKGGSGRERMEGAEKEADAAWAPWGVCGPTLPFLPVGCEPPADGMGLGPPHGPNGMN